MTQPRLATQTEHGRMYARADGGEPEVPSITTVIGQQATDLGGWHGYMAAKAVLEDDRALRAGRSAGLRHAVIRDADEDDRRDLERLGYDSNQANVS